MFNIAQGQDSSSIIDHFMDLDLQQVVSSSTHVRGNILDLIFTNIVNFTLVYHSVDFADHLGVLSDFNVFSNEINHSKNNPPCRRLQTSGFAKVLALFSSSLFIYYC